jgi:hypothetical protein
LPAALLAAPQLAGLWGRSLDIADAASMLRLDAAALAESMTSASLGLTTDSPDPSSSAMTSCNELVDTVSNADRLSQHFVCARYLLHAISIPPQRVWWFRSCRWFAASLVMIWRRQDQLVRARSCGTSGWL